MNEDIHLQAVCNDLNARAELQKGVARLLDAWASILEIAQPFMAEVASAAIEKLKAELAK